MNKPITAHYFKLSTDQGNARAQWNYAFSLLTRNGIAMSQIIAIHDLKWSDDQGMAEA
jgi:hypothetical protein